MAIIFAETGLLLGFFLPGDSLLVTAGALVNHEQLNPFGLDKFTNLLTDERRPHGDGHRRRRGGLLDGFKTGPMIFTREQSLLFRKDHLVATQKFYEKHGGKTIIIARFMPAVRTFAPVIAGVGRMGYRRFAAFTAIGGVGWVLSMTFLGYFASEVLGPKSNRVPRLRGRRDLDSAARQSEPSGTGWAKKKIAPARASSKHHSSSGSPGHRCAC